MDEDRICNHQVGNMKAGLEECFHVILELGENFLEILGLEENFLVI